MSASSPADVLAQVAENEQRRFAERNLRVRRSPVVHAVRWAPWLASLTLPAPACGQGWSGTGVGELHPVTEPVTCAHCLAVGARGAAGRETQQIPLPLGFPA